MDRDGDDRRSALQRETADTTTSALADLLRARAAPLRIDHDHAAALEYPQRRPHCLLVAMPAAHREGAGVLKDPCERAAEELRLRHEAHAPSQVHRDEEVIECREVVGRDDRGPGGGHELGVDRPRAIEEHADRRDDDA
jgi:hypothetical protein